VRWRLGGAGRRLWLAREDAGLKYDRWVDNMQAWIEKDEKQFTGE
jgi:hypothetical protein